MTKKITIQVPVNRVEGDLEVRAEVNDGIVTDAWCSGTMFRGFELILMGRGALDGLVITPRICGICSTSHLMAAVLALDKIARATPPPNAVRVRNLALMTEHIQSDMRHGFLNFATDFANAAYRGNELYDEAVRRYEPFRGETVLQVIHATKSVLQIVAILGGQWPHSSYMVPGGVVSVPGVGDLAQCGLLLRQYRRWYEGRILGCTIERWLAVRSAVDLDAWLAESDAHAKSDLGFFIRFSRAIGLDQIGRGPANFISYGSLNLPEGSAVAGHTGAGMLVPSGFVQGTSVDTFSEEKISEHVASSWYESYEGGRHPRRGETRPYATGYEGKRYSWAKAPRYAGLPAETGPLAEMLVAGHPLFTDLVARDGVSAFVRQLARLVRPAELIPAMESWIGETHADESFYAPPHVVTAGDARGLIQASRGALGHWVKIQDGAIVHYQVITPTTWNASPRDTSGTRGPIEEALVGTPVRDASNPVELGHVVRSFDACLVCTVHLVQNGHVLRSTSVGGSR